MKVKISDVVVRQREVDLPETCPHCGAFLGDGKGLLLCYYEYAYNESKPRGIEVVASFSEPTDHFRDTDAPLLSVFCLQCIHPLVEAKTKTIPEVQIVKAVEDTVWSQCLDRLVLQ